MIDIFDTHTHLDAEAFDEDREEVLERARAAGVSRILTVGASNGFESAENALQLADTFNFVWASVGIHPHDAEAEFNLERLRSMATHPRCVAIGETGLDFYRDWSPTDLQYKWYRAQIELALEVNKPLIIHSRDSAQECLNVLRDYPVSNVGGVFHCYSEDAEFAAQLRELNFMVSFPGIITFKKADKAKQAAREIPLDQILVETDAPYLAPEPMRGKRCETGFVRHTAEALAKLRGCSLEEVASVTTTNALKLFNINQ